MRPPEDRRSQWRRVVAILDRAFELSGEARRAYLDGALAEEPDLRAEVEELLHADGRAAGPLDRTVGDYVSRFFGDPAATGEPDDLSGRTLGRYELVRRLGWGGMGAVYEALDPRLHRRVALKVLSAAPHLGGDTRSARSATEREATRLAQLNHPNIVTVHSIEEADGVPFLTMEKVEGESLAQSLANSLPENGMELGRCLHVARSIAEGLVAAHERGVVHRDLKPANVMITADDQVKILDFGLAELLSSDADPDAPPAPDRWRVRGTVPYMSPEQAEGRAVDPRSDLFSLGAILYEMLTGRRPFERPSPAQVLEAIARDDPTPIRELRPEIPDALAALVERALEKDPERRYLSARDLRDDLARVERELSGRDEPARPLRRLGALLAVVLAIAVSVAFAVRESLRKEPTNTPEITLAVVPFESSDPEADAFVGLGVAEEVADRLGSTPGLTIIAGKSTALARGSVHGAGLGAEFGAELGADYVLTGAVGRSRGGGSPALWVEPRLVRVDGDREVWSERYENLLADPFATQSAIAGRVARALGLPWKDPGAEARQEAPPTRDPAAYLAYLRGVEAATRGQENRFLEMVGHFERAVELDRTFGLAWARLSVARSLALQQGFYREAEREEMARRVEAEAEEARRWAPGELFTGLAEVDLAYHVRADFDQAARLLAPLARDHPNDVEVLTTMGAIERRRGNYVGSIAAFDRVVRLAPRDAFRLFSAAQTFSAARYHRRAAEILDQALQADPGSHYLVVERARVTLTGFGDLEGARQLLRTLPEGAAALPLVPLYAHDDRGYLRALGPEPEEPGPARGHWLVQAAPALQRLGDETQARRQLEEAAAIGESLKSRWTVRGSLIRGLALAHLGRCTEALALASAFPETERDAFFGVFVREGRAEIATTCGDHELALDELEELLDTPYLNAITVWDLRLDPRWEPLRDDPRFQALVRPG